MVRSINELPPLGEPVEEWIVPMVPGARTMSGRFVQLAPLDPAAHSAALFDAYVGDDQVWDYLPYGPFTLENQYREWMENTVSQPDIQFYAIQSLDERVWLGVASYLRIAPQNGSIEVGHINFSPALQATPAATEAMFLMMKWAFEAGYRRYEWKCDALNMPSRRAAQRLGFSFEGVFRQATIVKNRNRDTAWFAAIDKEWPALEEAFQHWLAPSNFDGLQQRDRLSDLTASIRVNGDPTLGD